MSDLKKLSKEDQKVFDAIKPPFFAMINTPTLDAWGELTKVTFIQRFTKYFILAGGTFEPQLYNNELWIPKTWENPFGQIGLTKNQFERMNHMYGMLLGFKCAFDNHELVDDMIGQVINLQLAAQRKAGGFNFPINEIKT